MKKIAHYLFLFSLIVFFAACPLQSASAQVGGYMGIWGGYTIAPDASSDYDDDDWDWDDYYDFNLDMEETWALGLKVGFTHPQLKILAMEFEYSYLNPDIDRSVIDRYGTDYVTVEGDVKLNNFMFNLIAKYPYGVIHPYFGGGLGFSFVNMSATAVDSGNTSYSTSVGDDSTSFSWQLLTGVEIDLAQNLSVDIGYRYFGTELEFENNIEFEYGHSRDLYFTTGMFTLGLKFLF